MTERGEVDRCWIIVVDPDCIPERKGPFRHERVSSFLIQLRGYGPFERRTIVLTIAGCEPDVQSGHEYLDMARVRHMKPVRRLLTSIKRVGGDRVAANLDGSMVRIWSGEHRAYWKHGGSGYTDGKRIAPWVLPFREALAKVGHCCPQKQIAFEVAIPAKWAAP